MGRIVNSLLFRIGALFLLGLAVLQVAVLAIATWPDNKPTMFRLVDPGDAREIV